ncbi:MAG: DUF3598 family protein [Gomphosphaeria aponina SAG 52.96 = DSM 107014]|uniref:DUF3598 family protein n=1 Tax=Gomphosphaeria aponina SAG 52.96 = DSM 107014 TaxID=1521640 RepID=A0A941JTG5_9CHRO|nr:DUF3598 family protein [Gomphosphaeria aponina SAG 52.96 = DSM 107014]
MMNIQEDHWLRLFGEHTPEGTAWHAKTTVYSPDKQILRAYQFVRTFTANPEKTVITHNNKYFLPDGSITEKTWELEKAVCNQSDGVIHPESLSMRTLSLGNGPTGWICPNLATQQSFGTELFFRHQDWRYSVVIVYNQQGKIDIIVPISEGLGSFPDTEPPPEITNFSGNWQGKKEIMTPDLKITQGGETGTLLLDPTEGKNETFLFPDGLVVNIPQQVKLGEEFEVVAGKLVSDNEYKRLTVKYNSAGEFIMLTSEVFYLEN